MQIDKYKTTKGQMMAQGSGGLGELKIENSKNNHTFNSDLEDSASVQALTTNNGLVILICLISM
jgi:hypothetical protein